MRTVSLQLNKDFQMWTLVVLNGVWVLTLEPSLGIDILVQWLTELRMYFALF